MSPCPPCAHPCSHPRAAASSQHYLECCRGRLSEFPGAVALQEARYQMLFSSQTLPEPRALPQHLFITPELGQAVWFGIKRGLAGLLPATTVAHCCLSSMTEPFQKPWELGCPHWPQKACALHGCGRKTATPAGFNHAGCAGELGGMAAVAGAGAGSREIAWEWM